MTVQRTAEVAATRDDGYDVGWLRRPVDGFELRTDVEPLTGRIPGAWLWLVPRSDDAWERLRLPTGKPFLRRFIGLAPVLAKPDHGHERLLGFANDYGWLADPERLRGKNGGRELGEPVRLWEDEAAKVRDLTQTVRDAGEAEADDHEARKRLWGRFRVDDAGWVIYTFGDDHAAPPYPLDAARARGYSDLKSLQAASAASDARMARFARLCVMDAIELRRPRVRMAYDYRKPDQPPHHVPLDLVACVYMELDRALRRRALPLRLCALPGCARMIAPTRAGHLFCGDTHRMAAYRQHPPASVA